MYSGTAEPATIFRKKRLTKRRVSPRLFFRHFLVSTPQFHSWKNVLPSLILPENSSGTRSLLLDESFARDWPIERP